MLQSHVASPRRLIHLWAWTTLFVVVAGVLTFSFKILGADDGAGLSRNLRAQATIDVSLLSEEVGTVESRAILRQMSDDPAEITLREATLFHQRLIRTFRSELPESLEFRYRGPLAADIGRRKLVVHQDEVPFSLFWDVEDSLVVFSIWISTVRSETSTVAVCDIEGKKLFVNIAHIDSNHSPDDKLDQLGGRSVRDTLKLLEREPGLEKNDVWFQRRNGSPNEESDEEGEKPTGAADSSQRFFDGGANPQSSPDLERLIEVFEAENSDSRR